MGYKEHTRVLSKIRFYLLQDGCTCTPWVSGPGVLFPSPPHEAGPSEGAAFHPRAGQLGQQPLDTAWTSKPPKKAQYPTIREYRQRRVHFWAAILPKLSVLGYWATFWACWSSRRMSGYLRHGQHCFFADPRQDPTSRTPYSGLQCSYGVDCRALKWIYTLDPARGLGKGMI